MAQAKQGKVHKFGRHSRAPSNANQPLRTARNKRKRIEREAKRLESPKRMRHARGTARKLRRHGMTRQVSSQA